jgi:hypothetical protein
MEDKGVLKWIQKVCNIEGDKIITKVVDQFSLSNIESKLSEVNYDGYDKLFVNITGGTKIMSLGVVDFFRRKNADIYYITGKDCWHIFPEDKRRSAQLVDNISVKEYLTAYGFTFQESQQSGISYDTTKKIFDAFCSNYINGHDEARKFINLKRKKIIDTNEFPKINDFLKVISYTPKEPNRLSEIETKYLSGDWFEEYIGLTIKKELNLAEGELLIGTTIDKGRISEGLNSTTNLLGDDAKLSEEKFNNEMDVMFYYNNNYYSIECKSSIIAYKKVEKNGQTSDKPYNILGETIYKSDSLQSKFGLFPHTTIITLSDFKTYWKDDDKGKQNNKIKEMEELINRANHSKIKLVDKSMLLLAKSIYDLVK